MARTTVICGPMGCGKTSHAEHLRQMFGADWVVDGFDPNLHRLTPGAVHLTFAHHRSVREAFPAASVVEFRALQVPSETAYVDSKWRKSPQPRQAEK